jgi:hypothetical protein
MRTTVTLDPDVEQMLRDVMHEKRQSFKVTLNEAIRKGLACERPAIHQPPFVVQARPLGLRAGIDPSRLNQISDELEVETHLEQTRQGRRRRGTSR